MIRIQGICYDGKSSYEKGASLAPQAIRKALFSPSTNLYAENGAYVSTLHYTDAGDFVIEDYFEIEDITAGHIKEASRILSLGGDHSITFPIVKAMQGRYPKLDILHIDAHSDLYDEFEGDPYSHACSFARIMEAGLAARLVQVGIRTLSQDQRDQAEKFKVEIHEMKDWEISSVPEFKNPVYVSLDMDAFDPAFAPGISHYEPGGFSARQVLEILQNIKGQIVGADIVEYNPKKDRQEMTAYLAAKMMKEILVRML